MTAPTPRPGVMDIEPYRGGNEGLEEGVEYINLSANESPLGPSPKALEAYRAAQGRLARYPDGASLALRKALAAHHDLEAERIVCANGSDELIVQLAYAYAGDGGGDIVYSHHGFLMYPIAAKAAGARPVAAPEVDLTADVDNLLAVVNERTRIVFLANPNNPTGTYLARRDLLRLRAGLPDHVILVIDSAYAEYVGRNDYSSGVELARETPNTVMTRTFSKIYGLAGLRIGWAYAPQDIIDVVNRVRGPFNVNTPAQVAALAALNDIAHTDRARAHNDEWLPWLRNKLGALGLEIPPSVGNFLLVRFPGGAEAAAAADKFLRERRIIARRMVGYHLPDALRISVGTEDENRRVVSVLGEFMG